MFFFKALDIEAVALSDTRKDPDYLFICFVTGKRQHFIIIFPILINDMIDISL